MNRTPVVREVMTQPLVVAREDMDVHEATALLVSADVSGLPVVDAQGGLVGIVTERDCLEAAFEAGYHLEPGRTVGAIMSRGVETLDVDSDIVAVIDRFRTSPYRRFPVLDGTHLVGVLSRHDVLRQLLELA